MYIIKINIETNKQGRKSTQAKVRTENWRREEVIKTRPLRALDVSHFNDHKSFTENIVLLNLHC